MKSYYYFVRCLDKFSRNDVIYKVSVGISMSDGAKMALVKEYADDCGMYFEIVSETSDLAISNLAKSLFPGSLIPEIKLKRATVTISQLYQMILDDSFATFEARLTTTSTTIKLLSLFSPDFKLQNSQLHCITTCPTLRRKYLSQSDDTENTSVAIAFWLILGLFLLSGYLEGVERATYILY